jgi:phospholipid/cholesterol/gamma-HCH transport system substrate-binding protein
MRSLEPANRYHIGIMGAVVVALAIGVGQCLTTVPVLFAKPSFYGEFADTSGLNTGDKVRIAGVNVGTVEGIKIEGDHVKMRFSLGGNPVGTESRLFIRTDTLLGKRSLDVEPRGSRMLRPGGTLPIGQTSTPYQIYDAFADLTKAATGWNLDTVKESLNTLSQTLDQTSPHLSAALDGVAKFSDTIGKRDAAVKHLLAQANQVAGVLGDRSQQVDKLVVNANTLLAAFNQRGQAIDALLANVTAFSQQVKGLINDNPNLTHVLEQLSQVSDLLVKHKQDLATSLTEIGQVLPGLNESVASGPFFKVILENLGTFPQIAQPWVDAAFKKRGIDPEEFWRSAGLPAAKFPDPNGTRFPNGAPPPAPQLLEGTPEHPGPAVPPGTPCSYTPAAGALPGPGNPLPCAGVTTGPFGGADFLAPPDVMSAPFNPDATPGPGIPIAGRPGAPAPNVPGVPVAVPADAPPGARTEPVGPAGPTPPPSAFAPGLPPGPAAPPGSGPQLPAAFINPPGTGGSGLMGGSQN